ncbi:MAG: signal peptidase I [candidate division Zixibacteria bacterium HGW-Zixibacteria-1]|nr:MAG: signal peptidase I [candidate division Zixibacteria bacterium HGW-Zixibacteria-1]
MNNDFLLEEFQQVETDKPTVRPPRPPRRPQKTKPLWREYVEVLFISLAAAVLLRLFVVSAYRVDSASMEDSLFEGDYIFVNKLAYNFGEPQTNDVVVFKYPLNPTKDYIKRIVALPGQTVEIIDKVVYVDNQLAEILPNAKNSDPKIMAAQLSARDNFGPVQVPIGQYFVLGDNRDESQDSRFWGFVPAEFLKGKALFIYWSWEPDPDSPKWEFPYITSVFGNTFYFLTGFPSHTRWDRLFTAL